MKRLFVWGVHLLALLCFISAVGAEGETGTYQIGETSASITEDASGEGWSFDARTLTLTLDGISLGDDWETSGIDFSGVQKNIQIVLAPGSENQIQSLNNHYEQEFVICGEGTLEASMISGRGIVMESGTVSAGYIYCSMVVNGGCVQSNGFYGETLDVTGGEVALGRTKATPMVCVSGGTLNVEELDVYALRMTGGTVNAGGMSNCNGTSPAWMQYELSGGTFSLGNNDPENDAFLCVAYGGNIREFRDRLSVFANQLKDEDGDPITIKYFYYDENDEMQEDPPASYCGYMVAELYQKDGTLVSYAKADLSEPCRHEEGYIRATAEGHGAVCGLCGGDMEEMQAHAYVTYGTVKFCDCGRLDPDVEYDGEFGALYDEDVTEEIARLALEMWLGQRPMAYVMEHTLDPDWTGWITLESVARLQLIAQGVQVPENFTALGMSFGDEGKAMRMIAEPEDLTGSWDEVKVFVLDPVTLAPLASPIVIESK